MGKEKGGGGKEEGLCYEVYTNGPRQCKYKQVTQEIKRKEIKQIKE